MGKKGKTHEELHGLQIELTRLQNFGLYASACRVTLLQQLFFDEH